MKSSIQFIHDNNGLGRVAITGRLDLHACEKYWKKLPHEVSLFTGKGFTADASAVDYCDVSGIALLVRLNRICREKNISFQLEGLRPEFATIYQRFGDDGFLFRDRPKPAKLDFVSELGKSTASIFGEIRDYITFLGQVSVVMVKALATFRKIRWSDTVVTFEKAGVNALPVVALISFLVGLIISFQAAIPMKQFGVEIFVVNLLTIAVLRELGGFMTALVLSGRSGSAFAAEIGTMKVNEEVNALVTMGIDPVRFLVVSRMIAGIVLMPFLTMFANVIAIAGGLVVMLLQGFTPDAFFNQFKLAFRPVDLWVGLVKSVFFGAIVAGAGCYQGLKTLSGPTAVGDSTTRAVVSCIVLIVAVDGVFSVLLYFLGL